jgi:hypothetical protein
MRIAILIMAHKLPKQLNYLCDSISHPEIDIYIHIDKKVEQSIFKLKNGNRSVKYIKNRTSTHWGAFSLVETILNCYKEILEIYKYDYICNISGQDLPIKKIERLVDYIKTNAGQEFIECRPYTLTDQWWSENAKRILKYSFVNYNFRGKFKLEKLVNAFTGIRKMDQPIIFAGNSGWFCLSNEAILYILSTYKNNIKLTRYFKFVWGADEIYFSTVLYNSRFKEKLIGNFLFTEWPLHDKSHPKVFTMEDETQLLNSDKYFARKFDYTIDENIIKKILSLSGINFEHNTI